MPSRIMMRLCELTRCAICGNETLAIASASLPDRCAGHEIPMPRLMIAIYSGRSRLSHREGGIPLAGFAHVARLDSGMGEELLDVCDEGRHRLHVRNEIALQDLVLRCRGHDRQGVDIEPGNGCGFVASTS